MTELYHQLNENALREAYIATRINAGITAQQAEKSFDNKLSDTNMADLKDMVKASILAAHMDDDAESQMDSLNSDQENYIVGDMEEDKISTERFLKQTQQERGQQFTEWLLAEEREFLVRMSQMIDQDNNVDKKQLLEMRKQMRVPAMFRKFKLDDEQMKEVELRQSQQAEEFKEKVLRKIEEGSNYSSDFEEQEFSEWVSGDEFEVNEVPTIKVQRDEDDTPVVPNRDRSPDDPANMTFKPVNITKVDPNNLVTKQE